MLDLDKKTSSLLSKNLMIINSSQKHLKMLKSIFTDPKHMPTFHARHTEDCKALKIVRTSLKYCLFSVQLVLWVMYREQHK